MSSDLGAELYAQILAAPEDDAPRSAYADWLSTRGDPRGEFIALQLAAPGDWTRRAREDELFKEHKAAWEAPLRAHRVVPFFTRGFPSRLVCSGSELHAARAVVAQLPVERVTFLEMTERAAVVLAAWPGLARFRHIRMPTGSRGHEDTMLTDPTWVRLVESPYFRPRHLELPASGLSPHGHAALADAPWLDQLTALEILDNVLAPDVLRILVRRLGALPYLALPRCGLGDRGAETVAAGSLPRLATLALPGNAIGDEGAAALAASASLPALRELDVSDNQIGAPGAIAFATAPARGELRVLDLRACAMGAGGASALASSTTLRRLAHLDVRGCQLGVDGVTAFVARTGLPALTRLGISGNAIPTREMEDFADDRGEWAGRRIRSEHASETVARFQPLLTTVVVE